MWTLTYIKRDSSTSALVFLWGWWIGIPAAIAITVVVNERSPR